MNDIDTQVCTVAQAKTRLILGYATNIGYVLIALLLLAYVLTHPRVRAWLMRLKR